MPGPDNKERFMEELLDAHNMARARHGAEALTYDPEISKFAQEWAEKCMENGSLDHRPNEECKLPDGRELGESISEYESYDPIEGSHHGANHVEWMYNEILDYNYDNPSFSAKTGHFTALVWDKTKKLGAGYALNDAGTIIYVVFNYYPPGNWNDEWSCVPKPVNGEIKSVTLNDLKRPNRQQEMVEDAAEYASAKGKKVAEKEAKKAENQAAKAVKSECCTLL